MNADLRATSRAIPAGPGVGDFLPRDRHDTVLRLAHGYRADFAASKGGIAHRPGHRMNSPHPD